jgi:hypothetical protein
MIRIVLLGRTGNNLFQYALGASVGGETRRAINHGCVVVQ